MQDVISRGELGYGVIVAAYVPEGMKETITRLARQHERSVSGEVRLALRQYLHAIGAEPAAEDKP
jgi:hypothetical protein